MALRVPPPALVPEAFAADADRALIQRYAESRDEAAFAAVVARHARMVYGVCRRAVRDAHLAEDAFQAVFLVLASHPKRAAHASAVGGWLFGVARRVGLAARRREERHSRRAAAAAPRQAEEADFDDLLRVLDEELAALPDEFRAPLVACFLEERTLDEAARHLGWSVSTLRRRSIARRTYFGRLTRRGATLAAGLFAGFLAQSASAAVPERMMEAAMTSAPTSGLARSLAAEIGHGSTALKATLGAVVVALGVGGMAIGLGDNTTPPAPHDPSPAQGQPAIAPAPRAVDVNWTTLRGRIIFPEKQPLPGVRVVPAATIKDFEFFGFQAYRDVLIDPETLGIANAVVWLRPDSDKADAAFPVRSVHSDLAGARHETTRSAHRRMVSRRESPPPARATGMVFANPTPVPFTVHYQRRPAVRLHERVQRPPATRPRRTRRGRCPPSRWPTPSPTTSTTGSRARLGIRSSVLRRDRCGRPFHDPARAGWARGGWWSGTRRPALAADGRLGAKIEITPEGVPQTACTREPPMGRVTR